MRTMLSRRSRGTVLLGAIIVMIIVLAVGGTLLTRVLLDYGVAEGQRSYLRACAIAEAGFERGLFDVRKDFDNDTTPSLADGDINGLACGPDTLRYAPIPYVDTALGRGSYRVGLKNEAGETAAAWIRSIGSADGADAIVQGYVRLVDHSPWKNVLYAGSGARGMVINGNVSIRGPVHILGDGLQKTDIAMDMSGGANVGNNYAGMPAALAAKIPPCPTKMFNGELVETLGATVRVRHGKIGLSGTGLVGLPDLAGNGLKETIDGAYVTDGYTGNQGAASVNSDNGTSAWYDLGQKLTFPKLTDPYLNYASRLDYLAANAYVIKEKTKLLQLAAIYPTSSFSYVDPMGRGSLTMDGKGNMTVNGIVYIDGNLGILEKGVANMINYTGRGSLVVTGNVTVTSGLVTAGPRSFPSNILGIMTPNSINVSGTQTNVTGLFYAEDTITCTKQLSLAGGLVANYFDMGQQVPSVYYVPDVLKNLPPGLIGSEPVWFADVVTWEKIPAGPGTASHVSAGL